MIQWETGSKGTESHSCKTVFYMWLPRRGTISTAAQCLETAFFQPHRSPGPWTGRRSRLWSTGGRCKELLLHLSSPHIMFSPSLCTVLATAYNPTLIFDSGMLVFNNFTLAVVLSTKYAYRPPECIKPARAPLLFWCVCISAGMNDANTSLHWRQHHCVRISHFPILSSH